MRRRETKEKKYPDANKGRRRKKEEMAVSYSEVSNAGSGNTASASFQYAAINVT